MSATALSVHDPRELVTLAVNHLADTITAPAFEALERHHARRVLARVAALVNAGNVAAAETLVDDEIRLYVVQKTLFGHLFDCDRCAPELALTCIEYARLERRESALLQQVANAGGLR